ncbi:hypothetical protein ESCO_004806 [Escovopsis weberi]|uniref:Vezatin n=1 Tax=Escovopsis weberi TaxID=150374 RepID=A0A0M8MTZ6_ESCWE|nr:hypothetical protein ESCO_004806 [Escovopsis weberi]
MPPVCRLRARANSSLATAEGGNDSEVEWAPISITPDRRTSSPSAASSRSVSPSPYAPTGRPLVRARFRNNQSDKAGNPGLGRSHRQGLSGSATRPLPLLQALRRSFSAAVAARLERSDTTKFLEQFRYAIIASQLLSSHSIVGRRLPVPNAPGAPGAPPPRPRGQSLYSTEGIGASVLAALGLAVVVSWVLASSSLFPWRRIAVLLVLVAVSALVGQVYTRHKSLSDRRDEALFEISSFVSSSQDFDSATEATLSLVQEVELVSRGYQISTPLPPISRIEERSQSRKCVRLRKALLQFLADALTTYDEASDHVKGFSEQTELEKYFDMYDISDFDMSDARQGFNAADFEDAESLRTLKILAARFHTTRRMFLCALLALDANGQEPDLPRWTAAVEALRSASARTKLAYERLQAILSEAGSFPLPPTPKSGPLTPGKERWRSQLRKLDSLSSGIRGLQAKLHLLKEESDRALDGSNDLSELGPNLMAQYDSIGAHLKELMSAWEDGRTALALGIDRNEKRISSMSTLVSQHDYAFGALETVGEGGADEAFKALTGESPPASDGSGSVVEEVFEAVAAPRQARPRSLLTREERIAKMKEEREHKAQAQSQAEASRGMLRELESVISLRPKKQRLSAPPLSTSTGRTVSM